MFYDQLEMLCKKQGITISGLLKELNLSMGNKHRWQNGATVNSDILLNIALHFGVTTDFLLTGENPQISPEDKNILELYHKADEIDKQTINNVLSRYKEHNSKLSSSQSEIS